MSLVKDQTKDRPQTPTKENVINTHFTPAEKLTTGKKSPSVLKFSNMPWTGCPLILKEMLGAPRSRQQLTTSSEVRICWFTDATARGIRPVWHTHAYVNATWRVMLAKICQTHKLKHIFRTASHTLGKESLVPPAGYWFCLDVTWP